MSPWITPPFLPYLVESGWFSVGLDARQSLNTNNFVLRLLGGGASGNRTLDGSTPPLVSIKPDAAQPPWRRQTLLIGARTMYCPFSCRLPFRAEVHDLWITQRAGGDLGPVGPLSWSAPPSPQSSISAWRLVVGSKGRTATLPVHMMKARPDQPGNAKNDTNTLRHGRPSSSAAAITLPRRCRLGQARSSPRDLDLVPDQQAPRSPLDQDLLRIRVESDPVESVQDLGRAEL